MAKRPDPPPPPKVATEADIGPLIGRELKAMFDAVLAEPVPEKFRTLLEELARKSRDP
jgi:Anti-sigma factor NepR